jgi:hypothetical protein
MPDYKLGKIYAIRSHQTEQMYIGSTCETLCRRLIKHKSYIKQKRNCTSKIILEFPDAYIELIELFPCNSREELNKKEVEYIRLNNCVNKNIPCRSSKEWVEEHKNTIEYKEKNRERSKKYYNENKDKPEFKLKEANRRRLRIHTN